jgi:hypothetical protein
VPVEYTIDRLARRWHVAPWVLLSEEPEIAHWVRLGLLFDRLESQATANRQTKRR